MVEMVLLEITVTILLIAYHVLLTSVCFQAEELM